MPVKRKLNKKRTKVPRNVKINSKRPKRASQKKRGRSGRGRKSQSGGGTILRLKGNLVRVKGRSKLDAIN